MMNASNDEMVTLKEIVQTVLTRWKTISVMVILVTLSIAMLNFFILTPIYECKLQLTLTIPDKIMTEAGEFIFYPANGYDYMNFIYDSDLASMVIKEMELDIEPEDLTDNIAVSFLGINRRTTDGILTAEITFTGTDRTGLPKIANQYTKTYVKYLGISIKKITINKFWNQCSANIDTFTSDIKAKEFKLSEVNLVLQETPEMITAGQTVFVNPARNAIEEQIAALKTDIAELKSLKIKNDNLLLRFDEELKEIDEYYLSGEMTGIDQQFFNVLDKNVYITKAAKPPEGSIYPNKLRNIFVAFFLSAFASVLLVLARAYWKKF
ncbi:MAG: GumC domain-containing protein [Saccharofermentanales bacterium]